MPPRPLTEKEKLEKTKVFLEKTKDFIEKFQDALPPIREAFNASYYKFSDASHEKLATEAPEIPDTLLYLDHHLALAETLVLQSGDVKWMLGRLNAPEHQALQNAREDREEIPKLFEKIEKMYMGIQGGLRVVAPLVDLPDVKDALTPEEFKNLRALADIAQSRDEEKQLIELDLNYMAWDQERTTFSSEVLNTGLSPK